MGSDPSTSQLMVAPWAIGNVPGLPLAALALMVLPFLLHRPLR